MSSIFDIISCNYDIDIILSIYIEFTLYPPYI